MMTHFKYFRTSLITTVLGLVAAGVVAVLYGGDMGAIWKAVFLCLVLTVLETSISFDNAVVNASVLKKMTPLWQHRFLTWGMLIAVFGMRLIFPLAIVSVIAFISPWAALKMAIFDPTSYQQLMLSIHHEVSAFGGTFLLLVALKYFFNVHKDVHWIRAVERPLTKLGRLEAIEIGVALAVLALISRLVEPAEALPVVYSGVAGILVYLAVEGIETFLQTPEGDGGSIDIHRASLGMFLYLEVLDASFSFDGVIGAFAITNNLFLIMIGLGVGAMFVRSITILMVEQGTLDALEFIEHGAFYAVWILAIVMLMNTVTHVPEAFTGISGAAVIGLSVWSSLRHRKRPGVQQ